GSDLVTRGPCRGRGLIVFRSAPSTALQAFEVHGSPPSPWGWGGYNGKRNVTEVRNGSQTLSCTTPKTCPRRRAAAGAAPFKRKAHAIHAANMERGCVVGTGRCHPARGGTKQASRSAGCLPPGCRPLV